MHDANNQYPTDVPRLFTTHRYTHRVLYHRGNLQTLIPGIWECWLPNVMCHHSDDAAVEAVLGKVSKGFH
jgi:hypothetical protein